VSHLREKGRGGGNWRLGKGARNGGGGKGAMRRGEGGRKA